MKRLILTILICLAMALNVPVATATEQKVDVYDQQKQLIKSIVFSISVNEYFINGQVPGSKMDAAPYIDSDRTFVPVRFLGNALGVNNENITWDGGQGCATLVAGSTKAEMTIGKKEIVTNGQAKAIDVAPQLRPPGRTFLPARFVCEALGFEVDWQDERYVVVWPKDQPKPDITVVKQYINQLTQPGQPVSKADRAVQIATDRGYTLPPGLKVLEGYSNKYKLPSGLWVRINPQEDNNTRVEFGFLIPVGQGTEMMRQDAYKILESKFGSQLAREMIDYVAQKQKGFDDLPTKYWRIKDQPIRLGSAPGDIDVDITIWEPGVKLGI